MKVTTIQKPLEYTIEAMGEKWRQGDKLKGTLKIKNHGTEKILLPILKVNLCEGHYKKIKAKDSKGWVIVDTHDFSGNLGIEPAEENTYSFEFMLSENCSVTDKNGSLYLAFYDKEEILPTGNIELVIEPKLVIKEVLQILENFLRFKVKEIKSGKGVLEVKLIPPSSRELSNLDGVTLSISEVDKNLNFKYFFNLRSLDLAGPAMQVEKKTKEIVQTFNSKQYLIYGDSINQDFIIESVKGVLDGVKTKTL